jgi:undecaprenyl diphosphate synthase
LAKSRGLPRIKGHEAGAQAVRECVEGCGELKVEYLTLYAFSAETWQRPRAEIIALMRLLEKFLKEKTPELLEKNVRLQAIGRLTDLPQERPGTTSQKYRANSGNTGLILILALSYGGRLEIIDGIKSLLRAIELGHIDRAMIDVRCSANIFTRVTILIPTSLSARPAKCGSRIFCFGKLPTRRCTSRQSCGLTSKSKIYSPQSKNSAAASDVTERWSKGN